MLVNNILLISHTFATGPTQELRDFLLQQKASFTFIEHPFSYNKNQRRSTMTMFEDGIEKKKEMEYA